MEYTVSSPYLKMMSEAEQITEKYSAQVVISRNEFIFTTAAAALLAGLLAPVGARLVDVLWVLSVCLTGAVVLIGLAAKESGELSSFPLLLVAGSWLRIALAAASARLIFLGGRGGVIIESIGGAIGSGGAIGTVIMMAVAAASAGLVVYSATRRITKASLNFAFDTMPLKKISIETELNAGIIDSDKAASLKDKVASETQFYLNMSGVTKILCCDAAVAVLVVILTGAGQIAITAIDRMNTSGDALTQTYASLASGVAILALGPAVLTAMAAAHLLGKSSLSLGGRDSTEQHSRTIKIVSAKTGRKEQVELLNPDFFQVEPQHVKVKVKPSEENIARFEPVSRASKVQSKGIRCIEKYNNIEDYYNDIVRRIENLSSEQKVVLFGASSVEELPVTVAVNAGIRISKKGRRCLLIDADTERGAIGKVFELESEAIKDRATQTCIKNLSVRSGLDEVGTDVNVVEEKMQTIASDYDRVIIYAPNINSSSRCEALSGIAGGAIIFKGVQNNNNLSSQLVASGCELVAIMPAASIAV
jgi:hypothetical protein